jgi:hypothetical protein
MGGMIHFLKSDTGIYATATAGLLFQLVGVVLVVRDLMQRHDIARRFTGNMTTLESAHRELQANSLDLAIEAMNGDETFATMNLPAFETDLRARKVEMVTHSIISYLLTEVQVPNRWKTWVGPGVLLLGILLAYAASMLSVR